jgi:ATP-binding cassette subfamily F protein uup
VTSVLVSEGAGRWIEYAGGYGDMVAQRGQGVQARTVEKASKTAKPAQAPSRPATAPAKRKLSFNEQHDLKTLPARMTEIEGKIAKLQQTLADPTLYTRDPALFQKVSTALAGLQAELSAAEERWLELEILREELES